MRARFTLISLVGGVGSPAAWLLRPYRVSDMPIYEYQCDACGELLEKLQKISDDPLKDCPKCSKPALKKKISAAGFRLSGSGWYETDFKTSGKKNLAGDAGKGGSSSSSSTSAKKGAA